MGLASGRYDRSPVSPLLRSQFSFSSSGEDIEDLIGTISSPTTFDMSHADFATTVSARARLGDSLRKGSSLRRSIERSNARIQGLAERIPTLEEFMHAFKTEAETRKELGHHIDQALAPTFSVLRLFDSIHEHELHLSKGHKGDVGRYIEHTSLLETSVAELQTKCPSALKCLQRMARSLATNKAVDRFQLHKLNETLIALRNLQTGQANVNYKGDLLTEAFEQLETEFRRILTDYGRPLLPAPDADLFLEDGTLDYSLFPAHSLLPEPVVQLLQEIAYKSAGKGRLKNCLEIHEDVRAWKVSESFQSLRPVYLQYMNPRALDDLPWVKLEDYIAMWNQHIQVLVVLLRPERLLFNRIFSHGYESSECFGRLAIKSGLGLLIEFGEAFAKSQKEPQKLFKLLDMFEALQNVFPCLNEVLNGDGCREVRDSIREFQKKIVHGACKVFWEFGLQVELQRDGAPPPDGGVLKLVSYVVNYIKYLISDMYRDGITQVLKFDQSLKGVSMADTELALAILQIMESLHRNIEARSYMIQDPVLSCIFRINNNHYIYTRSKTSDLGALLGDEWLLEQRQIVESFTLQYHREAWGNVLAKLSIEGLQGSSSGTGRMELFKQRIKLFQEAFAEMYQKHTKWKFSSPELRQQIGTTVVQNVVSAYRSYVHNFSQYLQRTKDFMNSQLSPEDIEHMILVLFQNPPTTAAGKLASSNGRSSGRLVYDSS